MGREYPYPALEHKVNGKDVSLVGVSHDVDFLSYYRDYFEEIISKCDGVVIEGPVEYVNNGKNSSCRFYQEIGGIAHKNGKKIYCADPSNTEGLLLDLLFMGAGGLILHSAVKGLRSKVSRRNFLKKTLNSFIGSNLILGSFLGAHIRGEISPESLVEYGADDFLLYGSTDYRNIKIARGILKLCDRVEDLDSFVGIHGAGHYKTVEKYMKNPILCAKILGYLPFEIVGESKPREYCFKGNELVLKGEI